MRRILTLINFFFSTSFGKSVKKNYSEYKSKSLITAQKAKELLKKENTLLIDCRERNKYLKHHIEGSFNLDRDEMECKDDRYGEIKGMAIPKKELEEKLNKMGVKIDTEIILVGNGIDEYRLWWILDLYGLKKIKIVDGGYSQLSKLKIKIDKDYNNTERFYFPKTDEESLITLNEILEDIASDKNIIILDVRSIKEYTNGRIPNSIHIEWLEAINTDLTILDYEKLKNLYKYIMNEDAEIIVYCQSGVRSSHTYFVLKKLLGYKKVRNYDGSWLEWVYNAKKGKVEIEID